MYHSIRAPKEIIDKLFERATFERPHNLEMVTVESGLPRGWTGSILTYVAWLPWNARRKPIK